MPNRFISRLTNLARRTHNFALGRGVRFGAEDFSPFFVVGSGRSGTTLLRSILVSSPHLHIPPEQYALKSAVETYSLSAHLPWDSIVGMVLGTIEFSTGFDDWGVCLQATSSQLKALPESERSLAAIIDAVFHAHAQKSQKADATWGDKTPANSLILETLKLVFPNARFIHMLRDGVDVVSSVLAAGNHGNSLQSAANLWKTRVTAVDRFFAGQDSTSAITVRYEELVSSPRKVITRVCNFLDKEFMDAMLDATSPRTGLDDIMLPHNTHLQNSVKPVSSASIGKGRRQLKEHELTEVQRLIGPELERFGYGRAKAA